MKSSKVETYTYQQLQQEFENWLRVNGYSDSTVYYKPLFLREFFEYLEKENILELCEINQDTLPDYIKNLKQRSKVRSEGALGSHSVNHHVSTLEMFAKFLDKVYAERLIVNIKREFHDDNRVVFTRKEISMLYDVCDSGLYGLRDKVMLNIFYGCGLRKTEGENLNLFNLILDKGLIFIAKAKGNRQRRVPMPTAIQLDISNYIQYVRPQLLKDKNEQALFVSRRGGRMTGSALYQRLKKLMLDAGILDYKPDAGLHSLRHSIATHLLQANMDLEDIAQFLGHKSLESTQIYTHIANGIEN